MTSSSRSPGRAMWSGSGRAAIISRSWTSARRPETSWPATPTWCPCGGGMGDWMHINSMSLLGPNRWYDGGDQRFHPDNIIWDSRESNILAITSKKTGEIVWKVGPDYNASKALKKLGWIIGQHHVHMIPRGLPGEGNILVYDNGGWAGYGAPNPGAPMGIKNALRDYSRVAGVRSGHARDRLAAHPQGSRVAAPHGQQPLLQPFHQLGPAPAERQHPDHGGFGRTDHRGYACT